MLFMIAVMHKLLTDPTTGVEWEITDRCNLVEWLGEHYTEYGVQLELVTDQTQEGFQFVRGFEGFGGLLRFQLDFLALEDYEALDAEAGFM